MSYRIITGDCLAEMPKLLADGVQVDSVVTDPPYFLKFMGKRWDDPGSFVERRPDRAVKFDQQCGNHNPSNPQDAVRTRLVESRRAQAFHEQWARAVYPLLKPGGHLIALCGTRTEHRVVCAIEDAGFEIRDRLLWLYGCLSEDTEILVDGRWEPYHNAIAGRRALCYDAAHDEYSWQPIEQRFVYEYDDTAFRICSDHTDQLVSRNHRCLVERGGAFVFELAEEAARQRQARVPILEDLHGLLEALPLPHEGTGDAEPRVRRLSQSAAECSEAEETARGAPGHGAHHMRRVRGGALQAEGVAIADRDADMLSPLQWDAARGGVWQACAQGPRGVDCRERRELHHQDEWPKQPGLERRGDVLPQGRELQAHQVRPVPGGVPTDGPEGRLRDGTSADRRQGDRTLPAQERSGSPRGPRPAVERPAEPDAVREQSRPQAVRASRFTRTDLARIEPVHHVGRVWCVKVPTGALVARRNGKVFITGNSGFPKSHDVSKAIDRAAGAEREVIEQRRIKGGGTEYINRANYGVHAYRPDGYQKGENVLDITAPATEAARQWQGWGTALKPAVEIAVLARKPLSEGSVAANVLKHGTGALNIDACRVATDGVTARPPLSTNKHDGYRRPWNNDPVARAACEARREQAHEKRDELGRWPANVLHDGSPEVLEAFAAFGERPAKMGGSDPSTGFWGNAGCCLGERRDDTGTAARFFPALGFSEDELRFMYHGKADAGERAGTSHPTVKPIALMEWLVRLVTPPSGTVLDPFAGSGSTIIACERLGFDAIGIEQDAKTVAEAEERIRRLRARRLLGDAPRHAPLPGQQSLFADGEP